MIKRINKKGSKLLSLYWFAILVIVATGIVLMVNSYYGNPYDVRQVESGVLADHIANCIYFGGEINPQLLSPGGVFKPAFRDNFLKYCTLNFSVQGEFTATPYYVSVNISQGVEYSQNVFSVSQGNTNLRSDCFVNVADKTNLATCTNKTFYMKSPNDQIYSVNILAVVSKVNENTK